MNSTLENIYERQINNGHRGSVEDGLTQSVWLKRLVKERGFTKLSIEKRGSREVYVLSNGKVFYEFKKLIEGSYLQELVRELDYCMCEKCLEALGEKD